MNTTNDEVLFSKASFRKDTFVEIVHRKDIDIVEFKIRDKDGEKVIPFNLSLFEKSDNKSMVLNNINRANIIGRADAVLKNFLKTTMFKKLLDSGEIDQSEYEMRMGDLLNKI